MSEIEKLRKQMLEAISQKVFLQTLGEWAKDRIVKRTRLGSGVNQKGAPAEKLKALSEPYKERRKELRKSGKLSENTTPARSNLTKTGKMLDAVGVKAEEGKVEIFVKPEEVWKVKANADLGRTFFNLSDKDLKEIKTQIILQIVKAIKK